jgi:alginate O-acetyltransferase complex protein AlgI
VIFSSVSFLLFLAATLAVYAFAKTQHQRAVVMLAASLLFYASWRPAYLVLLGASLVLNYRVYCSLLESRSRGLLVTAVTLNLVWLGVIKYLAFVTETVFSLSGLAGFATPPHAPAWMHWALPLGISFYTFHMLSAMLDVYRGVWAKPVSFGRWCLYVSFFPHLIAGPILRPGQLIDQLGELAPIKANALRLGGAIFVGGLVKKMLLADNLAPIADAAYGHPAALGAAAAWIGTLAFAFQIYFDFSGYSEMAIGLARLFGVSLPRNFLYPYISRNPSEFWRRWHITLSAWLRDYLYIPLGGSRGGSLQTGINLMLTMLLGGLWHGASWTFVAWGGLHGLYLIAHRALLAFCARLGVRPGGAVASALSLAGLPLTSLFVLVTWVFFRSDGFGAALQVLAAMTGGQSAAAVAPVFRRYEMGLVALAGTLAVLEPALVGYFQRRGVALWWQVPYPLRGLAYAALTLILIAFGGTTQKFIYFDF